MSVKHLTIYWGGDDYHDRDYESVVDEQYDQTLFEVLNLDGCPEFATIRHGLFTARDWIRAVEYGMRLYKGGYTSIEVRCAKERTGDR